MQGQVMLKEETSYRIKEAKRLEIENLLREIKYSGYDTEKLREEYANINQNTDEVIRKLKELRIYSNKLFNLHYIKNSLKEGNYDLIELKHRYFEVLSYMRTNHFFTTEPEEKNRKLLYEVGYALIEKEILSINKSEILKEILNNEYDTEMLNLILIEKLEDLSTSTYINPDAYKEFTSLLDKKRNEETFKNYCDINIVTALVMLTNFDTLSKKTLKNIETKKEKLEELEKLKDNYNFIFEQTDYLKRKNKEKVDLIKKIKRRTFKTLILLIMNVVVINSYFSRFVDKKYSTYDVEITEYSTVCDKEVIHENIKNAKDKEEIIVYKWNEEDKAMYKYTYNNEKLIINSQKIVTSLTMLNLDGIKPVSKEAVEYDALGDRRVYREYRVGEVVDKDYKSIEQEKIIFILIALLIHLIPEGMTNNMICIIIDLIKVSKTNKTIKEKIKEFNPCLEEFKNAVISRKNMLNEFDGILTILNFLKNTDLEIEPELIDYFANRVAIMKDDLNTSEKEFTRDLKELKLEL